MSKSESKVSSLPSLTANTTDYVTSLAKGTFGAISFAGPIAAEIIGHVIPNQRADRLVQFVELLDGRVSHLEQDTFREKCLEQDSIDLIEDALFQAARAKSHERLSYIADITANGLTDEEQKQGEASKMLWLLDRLSDIEVVLLRGSLPSTNTDHERDKEYQETHAEILSPRSAHMGSAWNEIEEEALYKSYKQHLVDLGLRRPHFKKPRKNEFPEFDPKTGTMKVSYYELTLLGRMLLRYLNLLPEWAERR